MAIWLTALLNILANTTGNWWCITATTDWCRQNRGRRSKFSQLMEQIVEPEEQFSFGLFFCCMLAELAGSSRAGFAHDQCFELFGIAGRREAGIAGANDCQGLFFAEMWQGFAKRKRQRSGCGVRQYAQDGLAEAEHRICRGFERFCYGIVGSSSDGDLCGMMREESRGQAVGCGKHAVLRSDASESFQCFLGPLLIFRFVGEGVHANQGDCRD